MDISFGYWGVITAFAGVAYTSGKLIQNHLSPELKENITLWLWGEYKNTWAAQYCQLFDFVFGQRHLSISCFFRSCLGSLFAVIFCYFLFQDGFKIFGEDARIQEETSLAKALIYGIFLNFIPDYLSLLETRWLLKQLSLVKSYIGQFLMLLLDLILTGLIISLYIIAFLYLFIGENAISFMKMFAVFSVYSIFFYSTFLSTVWAWLYCFSNGLMKLFFQTPLNKILNIEEKPVEQIGLILAIIILLIGVSFSPMRHTNDDSPNFVEEIACYFTTSVCVDVGRSINNKLEKIRVFKKVCSGSSRERCVEAGVELYDFDAAAAMQIFTNTCHDRIVAGCWLLGVRLEDINNLVEAEKAYRKAIEISPGHSAPAYIALGHLLESRNELNEAEEAYRKAIEIVPDSAIFPD